MTTMGQETSGARERGQAARPFTAHQQLRSLKFPSLLLGLHPPGTEELPSSGEWLYGAAWLCLLLQIGSHSGKAGSWPQAWIQIFREPSLLMQFRGWGCSLRKGIQAC